MRRNDNVINYRRADATYFSIGATPVENSTGKFLYSMNCSSYLISQSRLYYSPPSFLSLLYNNTH
jgi:hypothetical protein